MHTTPTTARLTIALRTARAALGLTHPALRPPTAATGPTAPDGTADPGAEAGMATAEYAVGTLAAAAFAGLLLAIMRGGGPTALLSSLISSALQVG